MISKRHFRRGLRLTAVALHYSNRGWVLRKYSFIEALMPFDRIANLSTSNHATILRPPR